MTAAAGGNPDRRVRCGSSSLDRWCRRWLPALADALTLVAALALGMIGCRLSSDATLIWADTEGSRRLTARAVPDGLRPAGSGIRSAPWGESADATFQLLEITAAERPHVHDQHDLTIVVLEGHGVLHLPGKRYRLGPGDTAYIARGVPHHFHPDTSQVVVGIGIFVPRLLAVDRRSVPE